MSDFYTDLQATAAGVLSEFKQGVIKLVRTTVAPNEAEPSEPGTETTKTYLLNAVARGVSFKHIDGTLIVVSDRVVLCSTFVTDETSGAKLTGFEPLPGDKLIVDGKPNDIKLIKPMPAAGTPVAFNIFIGA